MKAVVVTFILTFNYPSDGGPQRFETRYTGPQAATRCAAEVEAYMREGAPQVPEGGSLKAECVVERAR